MSSRKGSAAMDDARTARSNKPSSLQNMEKSWKMLKNWKNWKNWKVETSGKIGRWKKCLNFTGSMQFLHWTLCLAKGTSSAGRSKSAVSRKWPNQSACGYCCHWWRTHREFYKKMESSLQKVARVWTKQEKRIAVFSLLAASSLIHWWRCLFL